MRQFEDVERRWLSLFNTSIGVDLRQAIRDDDEFDPCEDGLRSVCWKVFLLNGPLSKASWTKKLKDSRSAYTSLRDHFLKFIDNPNDLHSSADPLADDDSSPWATLRQDEQNREEIWQDVIRCNVDNYFFREPSTQRRLLDILFIYSKLNPDTGYRQGMHEILAPVLWVIYQDSINVETVPSRKLNEEGSDFMLNVLDSRYVEHDAFNLFCAIMQTTKTFYEIGDTKDSSAIVAHSERIHNELLGVIDPDLCHHLQVIGIVPQIFAIRWLRLLFGREFDFKDVLKLWDILFAENLNVEIIDMACVAILLRLRWQLIDADYTTAITSLTRLELPKTKDLPRSIIKDAAQLVKRRTPETGADITQLRTGKRQYINPLAEDPIARVSTPSSQSRGHRKLKSQQQSSPNPSPARFSGPQRQLEGLFSNVSSNFQKGAEGWSVQGVSKALRGAVGEARRNIEQLQVAGSHSRNASLDTPRPSSDISRSPSNIQTDLEDRLKKFEERNKALAAMLDTAQETLRKWKAENAPPDMQGEDVFNTALARIQFVSVYLSDADVPIPPSSPVVEKKQSQLHIEEPPPAPLPPPPSASSRVDDPSTTTEPSEKPNPTSTPATHSDSKSTLPLPEAVPLPDPQSTDPTPSQDTDTSKSTTKPSRPSLSNPTFSFMLGEPRPRPSFIRSKPAPEEARRSMEIAAKQEGKGSGGTSGKDGKTKEKEKEKKRERRGSKIKEEEEPDDGFTMSTLL